MEECEIQLNYFEKSLYTGRSVLKSTDTDPIAQLRKRLEDLNFEWCRIMNVDLPECGVKSKEYRFARNERYKMAKKVEQKIIENNFAIKILENVNN